MADDSGSKVSLDFSSKVKSSVKGTMHSVKDKLHGHPHGDAHNHAHGLAHGDHDPVSSASKVKHWAESVPELYTPVYRNRFSILTSLTVLQVTTRADGGHASDLVRGKATQ